MSIYNCTQKLKNRYVFVDLDGYLIDFLLVGGGGGGGCGQGGGGGGGGFIEQSGHFIEKGCEFQISVGRGGINCGIPNCGGSNGLDSSFDNIVALGGGGGGAPHYPGLDGGNGGGGGSGCGYSVCYPGGSGCYCGGMGLPSSGNNYNGNGGGGAGAGGNGCNGTTGYNAGNGGVGLCSSIEGTQKWYAGGGGGGSYYHCSCNGCGGCGYNYCGGGGCAWDGNGNDGIVVIKYPTACGYEIYGGEKYTCGGNTIHKFTYDGILSSKVSPITRPGIYYKSDLGLISISSDGQNWITITDKNLGATQVWNYGDTLTEANTGKFFQYGNNYGFPFSGATTKSTTKVDVSAYGPGNYYSSSTFIYNSYYWESGSNRNIWGWITGTKSATQGPCDDGFHIPTLNEGKNLESMITTLSLSSIQIQTHLHMPLAGQLQYSSGNVIVRGTYGYFWTLDIQNINYSYTLFLTSSGLQTNNPMPRACGLSIRPFKNEPVRPDSSWTVLYQS